jgi:hypothetical protein
VLHPLGASIATTMHSPKFFGHLVDEFAPVNADLQWRIMETE